MKFHEVAHITRYDKRPIAEHITEDSWRTGGS